MTQPSNDLPARVLAVLRAHLSPMSADIVLRRAMKRAIVKEQFGEADLPVIAREIGPALSFYLPPEQREAIAQGILALSAPTPSVSTFPIESERDISTARLTARKLATQHGGSSLVAQKIATIVSELARNILSYAGRGSLEVGVDPVRVRAMRIVAIDAGPGIAHVDEVLSGRYVSKTGLGKGLLGIRGMSAQFDIVTGPTGTRVEAVVQL